MSSTVPAITNVLFAGIGGQGVILASDMLAAIAFRSGFDVKKSELHGMSQRGGSVSSDVRFGPRVLSPMIPEGEADYLVVLSEDQVDVCRSFLKPGGVILVPSDLKDYDPGRSLNVAMLGLLNSYLNLSNDLWHDLLRSSFKPELLEMNRIAFEKGLSYKK